MATNSWTFGPNGVYTATWAVTAVAPALTVTLTAGGAPVKSFAGDLIEQALAQAAVNALAGLPFQPSDTGWLAWTYDPTGVVNSSTINTGQVVLTRVNVPSQVSCTNVVAVVSTAGNTLTSGQNFAGLYNSAGTRIGVSADQTTAWASTGLMTMALTGGPFTLTPGFYWVAFLSNGTTSPAFGRNVNNFAGLVNGANTAATSRYGGILSGQTTLPATITPGSIGQQGIGWWAALS